jgi:uncharacterized protein
MEDDEFEWNDAKAEANFSKHGVRFESAVQACNDEYAAIEPDVSEDYGEDRFILLGSANDGVLAVVFTERNGRIRIISAREANSHERRHYYSAAQKK